MSDDFSTRLAERKAALDRLHLLAGGALVQLQHFYDVELTYTSNAIEGNTLTARETAEVIEHGLTVGGKRLRDYLEAQDHYEAVRWMREIAGSDAALGELTVTDLHRRIAFRSQPEIAGIYSRYPRRIVGSAAVFPNAAKVPTLMDAFGDWLATAPAAPETAFEAHLRLVSIRPFSDGNGRTARLLMNLLLIRAGYPPVAVRLEDRETYLAALETIQVAGDFAPYRRLLSARLLATLDDYIEVLGEALPE